MAFNAGTWKPGYYWAWPMCHVAAQVTKVSTDKALGGAPLSAWASHEQTLGPSLMAEDEKASFMLRLATENSSSISISKRKIKCAMMCYRGASSSDVVDDADTAARCTDGQLVTAQHPTSAQFCCYEGCPSQLDNWYAFNDGMCQQAAQLS